jgi:hypothetical protein
MDSTLNDDFNIFSLQTETEYNEDLIKVYNFNNKRSPFSTNKG